MLLAGCQSRQVVSPAPVTQTREPVIALALGGGGAKGFAHIGVVKVLESHGIKAQIVTGTSAGSFVGALYASGLTPFELQAIALNLREAEIRDLTFSREGFLLGQRLQDYVNGIVGNRPMQDFPKRFAAVATEMETGRKVVFNRGNAGQAVRASCSIPNVFVPVTIAGKRYVDGGLVSPIPVETAKDMGADIIIAVDISARPRAGQRSSPWGLLNQTITIMGQAGIDRELAMASVVVQPDVSAMGTGDLASRHAAILAGERAAQAQLPAIRAAIAAFKDSPKP
ncbi:MAG: patatin-like phospholipase family protein [Moraxellaceae bacterium]|nr:patatin-like phospholipase family protein [Moraxellaceae bacterium]